MQTQGVQHKSENYMRNKVSFQRFVEFPYTFEVTLHNTKNKAQISMIQGKIIVISIWDLKVYQISSSVGPPPPPDHTLPHAKLTIKRLWCVLSPKFINTCEWNAGNIRISFWHA